MSDEIFGFAHAQRISAIVLTQALRDYRAGQLTAAWFSTQVAQTYLVTMGLDVELIIAMANTGELKKRTRPPRKKYLRQKSEYNDTDYLGRVYRVHRRRR